MLRTGCLKRSSELICTLIFLFVVFQMTSVWMTEDDSYKVWIRGSFPGNDTRVLNVLREHYLTGPSKLPYNLSTDPVYISYRRRASWGYINHYLKQFFINQTSGFFVEAGALDGEFLSNTLWLEQTLGWSGLLVESDRESYQQLLQKHRRAWSSNTCLSNSSYPKESVHVAVKLNEKYVEVPWYFRGASHEFGITMSPKYDIFFSASLQSYAMVQCFPLASYLWALNVTTVDLLSLDIQGAEEGVLRAFPWNDFTVKVIVVELSDKHHNVNGLMKDAGFIWLNPQEEDIVEDYIFVKKELMLERTTPIEYFLANKEIH
ncbi:protein Star-like [Palaemon carinicauda]|uniref:protein Star-like n=1 Tax=Palaemon carinicauda TaxID=392227 RepID=UPI0035B6353F